MDGTASLANQNPMLGCQLIGKSILNGVSSNNAAKPTTNHQNGHSPSNSANSSTNHKHQQHKKDQTTLTKTTTSNQNRGSKPQQQQPKSISSRETKSQSKETNNNNNNKPSKCSSIMCQTQEAQVQPIEHHPHETSLTSSIKDHDANQRKQQIDVEDLELITKEAQELKIKTRKLQLEIDEKNEIINVLKDELEASKELSDKYQKENIQLLKDSKRVKFLQDENDFLQDKVGNVDKFELEIKKLKEKLNEVDFLKLRISELEEDCCKAHEESLLYEKKCQTAEAKLTQIVKLDAELNKWKSFSNELESERNSLQSKLLESIEQETKLNSINKQVEDEVKRLRSLIKSYDEQRAEEQASNSLIMSTADLKQFNRSSSPSGQQHEHGGDNLLDSPAADTSIKFELDQQYEKELNEENRHLKQKLNEREVEFNALMETNREIKAELDGSKTLISDLRQDLACEKNLALRLTNQLNNFSRQMKNLDKQYFPMHVVATACPQQPNLNSVDDEDRKIQDSKNGTSGAIDSTSKQESSWLKSVKSFGNQLPDLPSSCKSVNHDKRTNQLESNNSNDDKITDNETRQQVADRKQSSKLSAQAEGLKPEKKQALFDNSFTESNKQSLGDAAKAIKQSLPLDVGMKNPPAEQTELRPSVSIMTNKSTVTLEKLEKNQDESCSSGDRISSVKGTNNNNTNCKLDNLATDTPLVEAYDRSESEAAAVAVASRKTFHSPPPPKDDGDEPCSKRKHVHGNNRNNSSNSNNDNATNIKSAKSESPNSNARSQSSSPSASVTIGHDSGFQSINHDITDELKLSAKGNALDGTAKGLLPAQISPSSNTRKRNKAALPDQSTPINRQSLRGSAELAKADRQSLPPTQNGGKVPPPPPPASASKEAKQIIEHEGKRSQKHPDEQQQQQQQLSTANISAKSILSSSALIEQPLSSDSTLTCSPFTGDSPNRSKISDTTANATNLLIAADQSMTKSTTNNADEHDNAAAPAKPDVAEDGDPKMATQTPIKLSRSTATSNFVRNSLPSRSVNLGHSKSSAYLDRIRASVTATTTTNTTSSFNEQTRNIVLSQQQPGSRLRPDSRYMLNCMLDHQHSERCFVTDSIDHLQASTQQMFATSAAATNHYHQHHHHDLNGHLPIRSSRQLNALIDPVSHERLIVSALHHNNNHGNIQHQVHNHQAQEQSLIGKHDGGAKLTEQQIAHLASLHHQHYYHHLQHMHQLHQLHHQHHLHLHHHRMHHKYQQQATAGKTIDNEQQSASPQRDPSSTLPAKPSVRQRQCDLLYSGGSQFYAPSAQLDQVYANTPANANNNANRLNEYHHTTNKLVKSSDKISQQGVVDLSGVQPRIGRHGKIGIVPQHHHHHHHQQQQQQQQHQISQYTTLPQIDEVNGLPSVETVAGVVVHRNGSPRKHHCNATNPASDTTAKTTQHNLSSNGSPSSSSSSPTSSASSNLSPSSASSSSSINSLSTSSAPLNRSALRHTTTDCHSRRQFSVERELINVMPMTAALSRVGSCRSNSASRILPDGSQLVSSDVALMQTPVKSQQPSMRTSKILNISQQSNSQQPLAIQQQDLKGSKRSPVKQGLDLTNIKLNQNLAYASLRAPKSSPSESGVGSSLISNSNFKGQFATTSAKRPTSSSTATTTTTLTNSSSLDGRKQGNNSATNDDGGNKSCVWFEYGCV